MAAAKQVQRKRTGSGKKGVSVGKDTVSVNLKGVEAGRRRKRVIPEGDYHAKLVRAEGKKFSTGSRGVVWEFEVMSEDSKANGWHGYQNSVLIDADGEVMTNNLWSFRAVLQAFSPRIKIPDSLTEIPLKKLVGKTVALTVVDGTDDVDRTRSEIYEVFNEDELVEDEDEEDEEEEEDTLEDEDEDEEEDEEDSEEEEEEDEEDSDEVDLESDELD